MKVVISTSGMSFGDVIAIARHDAQIEISAESLDAMARTRAHIERLAVSESPVYGISTGFGALAQRHIPIDSRVQL